MIAGGNILARQKILRHRNFQQAMTHAHFAPDHLSDAVRFNPLENPLAWPELLAGGQGKGDV